MVSILRMLKSGWWRFPITWWWRSLPLRVVLTVFLASVLVLVLASRPAAPGSGRRAVAAPAALGNAYERERRA